MSELCIKVCKVEGRCPVYKGGERIIIDGPEIDLKRTDRLCIHALSSLLRYAVAIQEGVDPNILGLAKEGNKAYIACVDPGPPFTDGGRAIFEVSKVDLQ